MHIGISFDGFAPYGEALSFAREAVGAGAKCLGMADHLGDREYQVILRAVQRNPGRLDHAAKELGISRTTLWRRMRKHGIKLEGEEE